MARRWGNGRTSSTWPGRFAGPGHRVDRPPPRPPPAPWEGPLVSDTTEIFTGSSGVSEAPSGQSGAPEGPPAEDAPTGAAASGAPPTRGAAAGETVTDRAARRGGSGLSGLLLPELSGAGRPGGIA